jgi:PIN domain nuclease of toxin-antitoxin system
VDVLDASALMAVINGEPGQEIVAPRLSRAAISAVNLSEVAAKLSERGYPVAKASEFLLAFNLDVRPFDTDQALAAAALRVVTRDRGLSFGDRACLALAASLGGVALTADRAWAGLDGVELIR